MSAGWEVGDLALCVGAGGHIPIGPPADGYSKPEKGRAYTVANVIEYKGVCGLVLEGHPSSHPTSAWHHEAFRKIKPDTEPCEEEFSALIKCGRKAGADS